MRRASEKVCPTTTVRETKNWKPEWRYISSYLISIWYSSHQRPCQVYALPQLLNQKCSTLDLTSANGPSMNSPTMDDNWDGPERVILTAQTVTQWKQRLIKLDRENTFLVDFLASKKIHTGSPASNRWNGGVKQLGVKRYIMVVWSLDEFRRLLCRSPYAVIHWHMLYTPLMISNALSHLLVECQAHPSTSGRGGFLRPGCPERGSTRYFSTTLLAKKWDRKIVLLVDGLDQLLSVPEGIGYDFLQDTKMNYAVAWTNHAIQRCYFTANDIWRLFNEYADDNENTTEDAM